MKPTINLSLLKSTVLAATAYLLSGLMASNAIATVVQFETAFGNFEVNLYDQRTPKTVANFLEYVNQGSYNNVIIHRSVSNFVIQGGGFTYGNGVLNRVDTLSPVENEPVFSSVKGSIAMAKIGGDPDSATSQWFFNLTDNSQVLDNQNGGFTVFGEITGDGMAIIEQIAALPVYTLHQNLPGVPLQNYDIQSNNLPDDSNYVIISSINIVDPATDSAANLTPPLNIGPPTVEPPASSGGGGSLAPFILAMAALSLFIRKKYSINGK